MNTIARRDMDSQIPPLSGLASYVVRQPRTTRSFSNPIAQRQSLVDARGADVMGPRVKAASFSDSLTSRHLIILALFIDQR